MKTLMFRWLGLMVAGLVLCQTACRSTPTQASGFQASVQIDGKTRAELQQMVTQVFQEGGFELIKTVPELVFDAKAGTMKTMAYSSLSGKPVYSRAKVTIKNDGVGGYIIGCNAYVVRDRGDPVFEEEQKLIRFSGGDYQKMLDQVKKRLGQ